MRVLLPIAFVLTASAAHAQEARLLYPAFLTAQVLDLHSTHQALSAGAMEVNPLMKHPAMRYTLKPLFTAAILASVEKGRVKSPKKAFWVLAAITAGTFAISWHNYSVARRLR